MQKKLNGSSALLRSSSAVCCQFNEVVFARLPFAFLPGWLAKVNVLDTVACNRESSRGRRHVPVPQL